MLHIGDIYSSLVVYLKNSGLQFNLRAASWGLCVDLSWRLYGYDLGIMKI